MLRPTFEPIVFSPYNHVARYSFETVAALCAALSQRARVYAAFIELAEAREALDVSCAGLPREPVAGASVEDIMDVLAAHDEVVARMAAAERVVAGPWSLHAVLAQARKASVFKLTESLCEVQAAAARVETMMTLK